MEEHKPESKRHPSKLERALDHAEIAAYPLSAVAGFSVFETETRKAAFKNLVSQGLFNDLQADRKVEYQKLFQQAKEHPGSNMIPQIQALEEEYRTAVRGRFKTLGMHKISDYWQILKRNQKQNVAILGATVSGVVLGSILSIANNQHWVESIENMRKKNDAEEHQR